MQLISQALCIAPLTVISFVTIKGMLYRGMRLFDEFIEREVVIVVNETPNIFFNTKSINYFTFIGALRFSYHF